MTGVERLNSSEHLNGDLPPVVARRRGEEGLFLSFDAELRNYMSDNLDAVEIDVSEDFVGSKEDVVRDVLNGGILMVVEYGLKDEDFSDVVLKGFDSASDGDWWSYVLERDELIHLYEEHGDEFELVREFFQIRYLYSGDAREAESADLMYKEFSKNYPDDEETSKRLRPFMAEISERYPKPVSGNL